VVSFDKSKTKRGVIEAAAQNYRKGFSMDQLRVMVP
jgi:hypothetical protein